MIVYDMDELAYHAHPALSSTGVRKLLPEYKGSPKKFQWARTHPKTSRAFDVGHAVHAKVLGVGAGIIVYPSEHLTPSGNVSTKAATVAWEDDQRKAGLTPVSPDDMDNVWGMAEAVLKHPSARVLFEVAVHREASVFAELDGVKVRARFDALSDDNNGRILALDLKSGDDATKSGFEKSVAKWGYEVQDGHYEDTYQASEGKSIDEFYFCVVERNPPYEVGVFALPEMWKSIGRQKAAEGRRIFRECTESGFWPGYDSTIRYLDPPTWLVFDHEAQYEKEMTF